MEAQNATTDEETVSNHLGAEIVKSNLGMSMGTIESVVGDRVKMTTVTGGKKSEPVANVAKWINADYTELR